MYRDIYSPERLVKHFRAEFSGDVASDYLTEEEHLGFVVGLEFEFGETFNYPFYMRSCAKPLQGSLIVDYDLDFSLEEIALCCGSHTGEDYHVEIAKNLLAKVGLDEKYLKCGIHRPISKTADEKLIKEGKEATVFHNNCVGKHILMLAVCKKNGWDLDTYYDVNHPLQQEIKEKIYNLCEVDDEEYPITKDGCGVPIHAMPLKNLVKGYLNLFKGEKYEKITKAFREYPLIIGGENRLDTKIIQNSKNLVAKVGACGLCVVVNLEDVNAFAVKIIDSDMSAREVATLSVIKKLNWANIPFDADIKTLNGDVIGLKKFVLF